MMNEAEIRTLADGAVAAGTATRADADAMIAADVAALNAQEPPQTPSQAAAADDFMRRRADDLVSRGEMTREQADAALTSWQQAATPSATPQQGHREAAGPVVDPFAGVQLDPGFGPPEKPLDYRFELPNPDVMSIEELAWTQEVFHVGKMPAGIAQQIFGAVAQLATQPRQDADIGLMGQKTMAELNQAYGANTDSMVALGRRFVDELDKARPGVRRMLDESGAGSHPVVVRQIIEHAARLYRGKR
ncbi:hypothetical protein [Cupriavidus sp. CuC1]|uniref:hypothetical protein n=1 Tax=Cupriavidus sp. CuC1 TaxID=3373131 RepID=UPI0037CD7628